MRILHLDAGREMRGGQWQVARLIRGLAAEGLESTLLAPRGAPLYQAARKEGWRVEPIGPVRAIAMAGRYDLVHAHDARSHTLAAFLRPPVVVSRRVAFPIRSRWKYARPRQYLAVSQFVKRVLMEGGVAGEKISVVYDGVPLLDRAEGPVVLAPAAQADPQKGTALAVEAARLAGVPLELSADFEHDLSRARLLVYITRSEGLGSAALLAMSAGVPVIASGVGGLVEVIRSEENGILVANDPVQVAAAMRRVLDDPGLARRLGDAGRRTILENFTEAHMVRRTMEVYRQVLA
jgi:Glycosyl transferases group 1/Glycosyltransferase Family 4